MRWLRATQRIEHAVNILVRPEVAIGNGAGAAGFAAFAWSKDRKPGAPAWMAIGAGMVDAAVEEWEYTREEALNTLRECLLHEWAHYEHWRDGRTEPTERGVAVRARNLLRQYTAEATR